MSTEENKDVIRRYRQMHNENRLDRLGEVLADNFTPHTMLPGVPPSVESARNIHMGSVAIFPDVHTTTEDLIAEGDKVVERWTQTATHTGAPFFVGNIPASGKRV